MEKMLRLIALACVAAWTLPALGQTYGRPTFTAGGLNRVAATGATQTISRINASTGAVTVISGSNIRLSSGSAGVSVAVSCGNQSACTTDKPVITVNASGTPSGRAAAPGNFTVAIGTATIATGPTGTNPISFKLNPIGRNASKTFLLGFDFPINATGTTGSAASGFTVGITRASGSATGSGSGTGTATANVFRAIAISRTSDLQFGTIVRPRSGSGTVTISSAGARSVTGTGTAAFSAPAPTAATFSVTGEGGQAVTIAVPAKITMTSGVNSLSVTTSSTGSGVQALGSSLGNAGSLAVAVGGSFPMAASTPTGAYSGTFSVTVQYN